jgi:hypothetical protein
MTTIYRLVKKQFKKRYWFLLKKACSTQCPAGSTERALRPLGDQGIFNDYSQVLK